MPVYELFGGPLRDRMRAVLVALRHLARAHGALLGTPPLRTLRRHRRARARGRRARLHRAQDQHRHPRRPGHACTSPASASGPAPPTARRRSRSSRPIERLIGTFREAVGPDVGLCARPELQLPHRGRARASRKLLEQFDMQWVEYDNWDAAGAAADQAVDLDAGLASCESLVDAAQYRPFLELHAMDVASSTCRGTASRQSRADRPDGRGVRDQRRAAQLLQPPGRPALAAPLRGRCRTCGSWRSTSTTCPGRTSWSPAADDRGRPHPAADGPGWGADIDEDVLRRTRGRARATRARRCSTGWIHDR